MSEHRMRELLDKLRSQPKQLGIAAMDLDVLEYGIKALGEDHVAKIWLSAPARFNNRDRVLWTVEILDKQLPHRDPQTNRFDDMKAEARHQDQIEKALEYAGTDLGVVDAYEDSLKNPAPGHGSNKAKGRRKDSKRGRDAVSQERRPEAMGDANGERKGAVIPKEVEALWDRIGADYDARRRSA